MGLIWRKKDLMTVAVGEFPVPQGFKPVRRVILTQNANMFYASLHT